MIFGDCPYCGEHMMIAAPEDVDFPIMAKIECEDCGKTFIEKFSRVDPEAYKLEEVVIDEDAKTIKLKDEKDV